MILDQFLPHLWVMILHHLGFRGIMFVSSPLEICAVSCRRICLFSHQSGAVLVVFFGSWASTQIALQNEINPGSRSKVPSVPEDFGWKFILMNLILTSSKGPNWFLKEGFYVDEKKQTDSLGSTYRGWNTAKLNDIWGLFHKPYKKIPNKQPGFDMESKGHRVFVFPVSQVSWVCFATPSSLCDVVPTFAPGCWGPFFLSSLWSLFVFVGGWDKKRDEKT